MVSDIAKGNLFSDGNKAPVGTLELTSSDVSSTIGKDNRFVEALAICKELVGEDTQEIVTMEVENICASIDTTQKLSDNAKLNEDRVEKNLPENTPMLLDIGAQLNEARIVDIDKGMQPVETTTEDKRQDIGVSEGKGSASVGMQTPFVSQNLDQISSDASQLIPNPKRRKISSSPICDTSDILNFNLCSFLLGSTQGSGSEGNSAAVVVGEERQEHHEQQRVCEVSENYILQDKIISIFSR